MEDCPASVPYEGAGSGSDILKEKLEGMDAPATVTGINFHICQAVDVS